MFIHLTLVPYIGHAGELKTKPTQHSVNELRRIGIAPDMLMCRSEGPLSQEIRKKIALFASLPVDAIVSARDVDNIYKVPLSFASRAWTTSSWSTSAWRRPRRSLSKWQEPIEMGRAGASARCGSRSWGSTSQLEDAYLSVSEALRHAGALQGAKVRIDWIDSERLEDGNPAGEEDRREAHELLENADGILIPGGFGGRGVEGKIEAARVARENRIPYLGICLGMQIAVAEFARHVRGDGGRELDRVRHRDALSR